MWATDLLFICGYNADCNGFIYCLHLCCAAFGSKLRVLNFSVYAEVKIHYHFSDVGQPNLVVLGFFMHPTEPIIEV